MTLDQAAAFFGGKKRLATALGLTPAAISMWGESVPFLRQCQIQVISGGRLMADDHAQTIPLEYQSEQTANPAGRISSTAEVPHG